MSFKIAPFFVLALIAGVFPVEGAPEGGAGGSLATLSKPGDFSAFERAFDVSVAGVQRACLSCNAPIGNPCNGMCCDSPPYYCCIASGGLCYCGCN